MVIPPHEASTGQVEVVEVKNVGLRLHNGFSVGYSDEHSEYIPLDCHLIIRVANKQQLDQVVETLKRMDSVQKEGLCVVVDSQ